MSPHTPSAATAEAAAEAWTTAALAWTQAMTRTGTAPATVATYRRRLADLTATLPPGTTPAAVTPTQVTAWLAGHGWAPATRARALGAVRSFYAHAAEHGHHPSPELADQLRPGHGGTPPRTATDPAATAGWTVALAAWTDQLAGTGKAPATIATCARHVEWLAADVAAAHPDPWTLTPPALAGWLDAQPWSVSTRRKVLASLRGFYTWAVLSGHARRSPLAGIGTVPPRRRGPARLAVPQAWADPLADYLTSLAGAARQPGTVDLRRWWLTRLGETYADPWTITADDLARWLSRPDWSPETKRSARASVRTFYRWAVATGRCTTDPTDRLAPVRVRRTVPRRTTDDAVRHALAVADDRTRLALLLAGYAGLRRAEIAGLHTRDIGQDTLRVLGKGGHERLLPLHPDLAAALRTELRRRAVGTDPAGWPGPVPAPDGWLFPSEDPGRHLTPGHLGKLVTRALPPGWTTHTLRHRFATQAYAAGHDLRAVQQLLGHSRPETTARYAAVPDGALTTAVLGTHL